MRIYRDWLGAVEKVREPLIVRSLQRTQKLSLVSDTQCASAVNVSNKCINTYKY